MPDETTDQLALVPPKKPKGFQPGHPRFGGRMKGKPGTRVELLREIAARDSLSPAHALLQVALTGTIPAAVTADGTKVAARLVSPDEQLKCLRDVMKFIEPGLSAIALTGADGGPLQIATLDVVELMRNPALAKAAQTLALGLSTAQREGITAISNQTDDIIDAEECQPD